MRDATDIVGFLWFVLITLMLYAIIGFLVVLIVCLTPIIIPLAGFGWLIARLSGVK